jgi:hypothetical protein
VTAAGDDYELLIEERPGYVYAYVRGATMNLAAAKRYLSEVARRCDEIDCSRLMLERDVPVLLSEVDMVFAVSYFLELMKGRRIAFVNRHTGIHNDLHRHILTGTKAGGHYRLFDNVMAAEKWLTK